MKRRVGCDNIIEKICKFASVSKSYTLSFFMGKINTSRDRMLIFNTRDELTRIRLDGVCYFESDGNYTHVYCRNGVKASLLTSLVHLEELIADICGGRGSIFIRIGKKYIVNTSYIFQINVLRQRLVLSDLSSTTVYTLPVAKEALKKLKTLYMPAAERRVKSPSEE